MLSCSPIFHVKFLALVQGIFSIGTRYPRNSWETLTVLYTLQKLSSYSLVPPPPPPHPKVSHVPLFPQLTCSLFPYKLFRFVPLVVPTLQNMPCSLETSGRASLLSYTRNVLCVGSVAIVNMGIWDHQIAIYLIGFSAFGILVILL